MALSGIIRGIRFSGMACAVPENIVSNENFKVTFGEEQILKFEKMVGVKERCIAALDERTSTLALVAARRLLAGGYMDPASVDAVLFVSQTPDYKLPATACVVQNALGIKKDCIAYDINLGCSGFVYGVLSAAALMKMDGVNKVLLCGGDTPSKIINPSDAASAPLFGDAGFATLLVQDEQSPDIRYAFKTDGSGSAAIECEFGQTVKMDGMDVFNFTINEVPDLIKSQMEDAQLTADQVDYLVLHQANKFVLKQVAMMTGFSMKKVPITIDRFGNTSSASIPLTLCDLASKEKGIKKMVMSGFGVGLSWGTLITDFDLGCCLPMGDSYGAC